MKNKELTNIMESIYPSQTVGNANGLHANPSQASSRKKKRAFGKPKYLEDLEEKQKHIVSEIYELGLRHQGLLVQKNEIQFAIEQKALKLAEEKTLKGRDLIMGEGLPRLKFRTAQSMIKTYTGTSRKYKFSKEDENNFREYLQKRTKWKESEVDSFLGGYIQFLGEKEKEAAAIANKKRKPRAPKEIKIPKDTFCLVWPKKIQKKRKATSSTTSSSSAGVFPPFQPHPHTASLLNPVIDNMDIEMQKKIKVSN